MQSRAYAIVEAPSALGLTADGVEELPGRLIKLGLADRLGARRGPRLSMPRKNRSPPDPQTRTLNAREIAEWTPKLADAVEAVLARGEFPVILGGDCTILLGSMLALRRRGRYGLLFIDGHADFFQPEAEPNGEAASMELAFATGYGPPLLTNLEDRRPLVRAEDVVAFGYRDHQDQAAFGSQPLPAELLACDIHCVRRLGAKKAARDALGRLTRADLDGFFIHLDADVLDDAVMPAVDFRMPGGLLPDELTSVLRIAAASDKAVGLEVTIYNPRLDAEGAAGRILADILASALR
jgi:arginase